MRCDNCKHWAQDERHERMRADGLTVRICKRAPQWWNATEWRDKGEMDQDTGTTVRALKSEHAGTKMFVQDGSDYLAYLYTAADFYCAHYEPSA